MSDRPPAPAPGEGQPPHGVEGAPHHDGPGTATTPPPAAPDGPPPPPPAPDGPPPPPAPAPPDGFHKLSPPDDVRRSRSFQAGDKYNKEWAKQSVFTFNRSAGSQAKGGVHFHCHMAVADKKRFNARVAAAEASLNAEPDSEEAKRRKRST